MPDIQHIDSPQGRRLACVATPGAGPGIVFLGGYRSDMTGTKAVHLEAWAAARGRSFLRFDYSGHGASQGVFEDGTIGQWAEDALAAITHLTEGPQVLVGSSMGGWIALLLARAAPDWLAGLVTVAAAPDFTEDGFWAGLDDARRADLMASGRVLLPSGYDDGLYVVTRALIEDGRENLVLRTPLRLTVPVRMLQGTADEAVETEVALRLLTHADGPDLRLTLVKGADHRFSSPDCLAMIETALDDVLARAGGTR